jgi:hypothetical protein
MYRPITTCGLNEYPSMPLRRTAATSFSVSVGVARICSAARWRPPRQSAKEGCNGTKVGGCGAHSSESRSASVAFDVRRWVTSLAP